MIPRVPREQWEVPGPDTRHRVSSLTSTQPTRTRVREVTTLVRRQYHPSPVPLGVQSPPYVPTPHHHRYDSRRVTSSTPTGDTDVGPGHPPLIRGQSTKCRDRPEWGVGTVVGRCGSNSGMERRPQGWSNTDSGSPLNTDKRRVRVGAVVSEGS